VELSHERVSRVMPEHRGDGARPGPDCRCGRDAIHAAHGVGGGGPAVVGRRRGEVLFRRGNLSSDSIGGLALALPREGRFPQASLSSSMLRTGSGEGGDSVSPVGDRRRRRRIDNQRRGDWRWRVGILQTGSSCRNHIRDGRKSRGGACSSGGPTGGARLSPPRGQEGRGDRIRPPRARHQGWRASRGGSGGWQGVGHDGAPARGGGAHPGGEGREGGGGERGALLTSHGRRGRSGGGGTTRGGAAGLGAAEGAHGGDWVAAGRGQAAQQGRAT
jgi:translation initiation factor IF-2